MTKIYLPVFRMHQKEGCLNRAIPILKDSCAS